MSGPPVDGGEPTLIFMSDKNVELLCEADVPYRDGTFSSAPILGLNFAPETVQVDFERSAYNAVRTVLPAAHLHGCFFHYTQCTQ